MAYRTGVAQAVPNSAGTEPPRTPAPSGATDCHIHIYDPRSPLGSSKHLLRIHVSADEEPQVAVATLDDFDAGHVRPPLRRRALELQVDPTTLRGPPQRGEVALRGDAAVVDDRDVLADVFDQLQLMTGEDNGSAACRLIAEHLCERAHRDRVEAGERLIEHQ